MRRSLRRHAAVLATSSRPHSRRGFLDVAFQRVASCLSVLVIAAGCASTTVTEQHFYAGTAELARPDRIYVYPFAETPGDIPTWSAAAGRHAQPRTAEELEAGRKLGALVANELVSEIQGMGLPGAVCGAPNASAGQRSALRGLFRIGREGQRRRPRHVRFRIRRSRAC